MLSQLLPTTRIRYKAVLAVIERPGPYFQGGLNVILEASAQLLSTTRIRYKAALAVIGRPRPYFHVGPVMLDARGLAQLLSTTIIRSWKPRKNRERIDRKRIGNEGKILRRKESFIRPFSIPFLSVCYPFLLSFCDPILFLSFLGFQLRILLVDSNCARPLTMDQGRDVCVTLFNS